MPQRQGCGFHPVGDPQFRKDIADVHRGSRPADHQAVGNLRVVQSLNDQFQHLQFPVRKVKAGF